MHAPRGGVLWDARSAQVIVASASADRLPETGDFLSLQGGKGKSRRYQIGMPIPESDILQTYRAVTDDGLALRWFYVWCRAEETEWAHDVVAASKLARSTSIDFATITQLRGWDYKREEIWPASARMRERYRRILLAREQLNVFKKLDALVVGCRVLDEARKRGNL